MEVCRTCLSDAEPLLPLFLEGEDNCLFLETIRLLTSVDVRENKEDFPKLICQICTIQFNEFYTFRNKVQETNKCLINQKILLSILKPNQYKHESDGKSEGFRSEYEINKTEFKFQHELQQTEDIITLYACHLCEFQTTDINQIKTHQCEPRPTYSNNIENIANPQNILQQTPATENTVENTNLNTTVVNAPVQTTEKNLFKCKLCNFQTSSKGSFKTHKYRKHIPIEKQVTPCDRCGKMVRKEYMSTHVLTHKMPTDRKTYKCNLCPYKATAKSTFNCHRRTKHPKENQKNYKCDLCNYETPYKSVFIIHESNKHKTDNTIICEKCGKIVKKIYLPKHMILHAEQNKMQKFNCPICTNYTTCNKNTFREHMRRKHPDPSKPEKIYKCIVCSFETKDYNKFKFHKYNKHTPEENRSMPCSICGKKIRKYYMAEHKRIHNPDYNRIYECSLCGYTTLRRPLFYDHKIRKHCPKVTNLKIPCKICTKVISKRSMYIHLKTHSNNQQVSCEICGKVYKNKASFQFHPKMHKRKDCICEYCGKTFEFEGNYLIHLRRHKENDVKKHNCPICHKDFATKQGKDRHILKHTGFKPFQCKVCKKKFATSYSVKMHMRMHNNEQPFICQICKMGFRQKIGLKTHLKVQHGIEVPFEDSNI